ncbi:fucose permease [Pedobacter sp. CG_S7]|uniref:MFS transporter n=1 Tax=Pedobacter sp. CG_S7 TaxID=3143930 RepID=UPI003391FD9C
MKTKQGVNSNLLLIIIAYLAFISLGLPDGLLGISWPFISGKLGVPLDALGVLLISFVAGYLSTSTTSGKILRIIPIGLLLAISCSITGLSLLAFAYSSHWFLVIIASFFLGSGGGAIDTSINVFAASRFSASVVNWLHAFYGIGATSGPFIITLMLLNGQEWYHGYIAVGIVQILLAFIFLITLKYWKTTAVDEVPHLSGSYGEAFRLPLVWINIFIFFLYTGLEIGVGQWIFTVLTESRSLSATQAGLWTSAYWGSLTAGRIVFGFVLTRIPVHKVIVFALIGVVTGTFLLAINQSHFLNLTGIILIGVANAPIFPCLISITPLQVGVKHSANVIGFLISAAMIGGAILPWFSGYLTVYFGWEIIPLMYLIEAVLLLTLYSVSRLPFIKNNK